MTLTAAWTRRNSSDPASLRSVASTTCKHILAWECCIDEGCTQVSLFIGRLSSLGGEDTAEVSA